LVPAGAGSSVDIPPIGLVAAARFAARSHKATQWLSPVNLFNKARETRRTLFG